MIDSLAERIRSGDADAFGELVQQVLDEAVRVAFYVTGDRDSAKDVAQSALIRIWELRESLDPSRPIRPYVFAIVRNRALDELKSARVRVRHHDRMAAESASAHVSTEGDEAIMTVAFEEGMASLAERQRTALRLRYLEQLSFGEIGTVLGISANAAHQLTFRAVRTLRDRLKISG